MNTHELWQAALAELELKLSKAHFTTWFKQTFIVSCTEGDVTIAVPNSFTRTWLSKKYQRQITEALERALEAPVRKIGYEVELKTPDPAPVIFETVQKAPVPEYTSTEDLYGFSTGSSTPVQDAPRGNVTINPSYTFDSYVVGKQNELAHAAAQAVAMRPGGTYNPVFIYGGVGLGKTHLLHSIANTILRNSPNANVLYVTCEHFTNDFIQSVRSGRAKDFKDRYRNVDLLLIDDIQFITGKEGTQEEFFHTFNTLHQNNRQIVISSDRPPKSIASLEKRLLSRLEWGMLVDVGAPDLETRIAILESKSIQKGFPLGKELLHHVADRISSNVRELEGALNKIIAYHQFKNLSPSIESILPVISSLESSAEQKTVSPKEVIKTVTSYFDIEVPDVLGKSREKRLAFPRQIIMYLLREEMRLSYPSIGTELGGRDHTTAMHAYSKIHKLKDGDEKLQRDLEVIKEQLYTGA
ncbi:MAG: chromosomal replication initiator protein DnaA [bacterium]|nr:chromosomal replication initiator protein DnaA [bacterium]MDA1024548.1 chromosomal replication initiator protein DnaA [bacterium]